MTLGEFVIKYYGVKVDFDGAYGAQCVDLVRQYFKDVWELPKQPEGVVGAQDFFWKHNIRPIQVSMLYCMAYEPNKTPPEGAVVLFRATGANQYGHIGICVRAENNIIYLLEQDGFKQDGVKISAWSYANVLGWLIKKEG